MEKTKKKKLVDVQEKAHKTLELFLQKVFVIHSNKYLKNEEKEIIIKRMRKEYMQELSKITDVNLTGKKGIKADEMLNTATGIAGFDPFIGFNPFRLRGDEDEDDD